MNALFCVLLIFGAKDTQCRYDDEQTLLGFVCENEREKKTIKK